MLQTHFITLLLELCNDSGNTAQKNGDRGKRTSDRAQTRDLHSFAELQPRAISPSCESFIPPYFLSIFSYVCSLCVI